MSAGSGSPGGSAVSLVTGTSDRVASALGCAGGIGLAPVERCSLALGAAGRWARGLVATAGGTAGGTVGITWVLVPSCGSGDGEAGDAAGGAADSGLAGVASDSGSSSKMDRPWSLLMVEHPLSALRMASGQSD